MTNLIALRSLRSQVILPLLRAARRAFEFIVIMLLFGHVCRADFDRPTSWIRGIAETQNLADAFRDGRTLVVFAHQDDDLLWMLPFWPVAAKFVLSAYAPSGVFQRLVESFPPQLKYADRWSPAWGTVDNDVFAEVFTDPCKRAPIVNFQTIKAHLRPYFTPAVKRVVTHDNWGEYGHAEHRAVNAAVRQLAVEAGIDVWAFGGRVDFGAAAQSGYINVAKSTGLPMIEGYFDPDTFRAIRKKYLGTIPTASTPEITKRFRKWSPSLWTWSDASDAFPKGWRPFIRLVNRGVDLTAGNAAVERLVRTVPVIKECATLPILPSR